MQPLGLCALELRNIIEQAFLPRQCTCSISPDQSLSVEIKDPRTGHVELFVTDISPERLSNNQEISRLVAELQQKLASAERPMTHAKAS